METWQLRASSSTYQDCPADSGRDAERSRSLLLSRRDSVLTHKQEEAGGDNGADGATKLKNRNGVDFPALGDT